ncbi:MAG: response regulator receiver protein [Phycisphaerales bacterium]|nr:response regulator receiver protein [Phycisphaerales bacterium]
MQDDAPRVIRIRPVGRPVGLTGPAARADWAAAAGEGGDADAETIGHVERVCAYAEVLARRLVGHRRFRGTVTEAFVRRLGVAAALHDAGKAALPPALLRKPARLTPAEIVIIRRHPTLGAAAVERLLAGHPDAALRAMAAEVALTHHERWDGDGYPHGLVGDAIPISGRIVAVADVYDALTSARAYKPALPHAAARAEIMAGRGTHFDPAVVDAFAAAEPAILGIAAAAVASITGRDAVRIAA